MILVEKRRKDGKTEYLCPICLFWDKGRRINVTGYTEVVCTGCGHTFDTDYYDTKEFENDQ